MTNTQERHIPGEKSLNGNMPLTAIGFPNEASFTENTKEIDTVIPGEARTGNHIVKDTENIILTW